MQRGFRLLAIPLLGGMALLPLAPLPSALAQPPAAETEEDILVIARKLRKVRLDYRQHGSRLSSCTPDRKTGDARIGRLMCAVLRACIEQEKAVEVSDAKRCLNRRLDSLEGFAVPDVSRPAAITLPPTILAAAPVPMLAPPIAPDAPPDIVVTARAEDPDIVVTASGGRVKGGLWIFRRSATLMFGTPDSNGPPMNSMPSTFSICIPDGGLEETLRRAAGEGSSMPRMTKCGRMRMTIAGGRISGSRSCLLMGPGTVTNSLRVSGRYDAKTLTINFGSEQDHDGIERVSGGPTWRPKRPIGHRWRVIAERSGACPAKRVLRQVSSEDAVDRIFSESGGDEI